MNRRYGRFVASLAAAVFALFLAFFGRSAPRPGEGQFFEVRRVIDGDTVELSGGRMARYIGIDTPETRRRAGRGWREVNEPYAREAKAANAELVSGRPVRFEFDVQRMDKYNRLLVYCFSGKRDDEIFVQAELLKRGLAYLYTFPPNVKYTDVLVAAQKEAREKKRGIWSQDLDIASVDAARFLGRHQFVSGRVVKTRATGKTIRLLMEGLTVVIFKKDLGLFERSGIAALSAYTKKKVRVFGLIKQYRGDTEIIVSHPSQIEIVDSP